MRSRKREERRLARLARAVVRGKAPKEYESLAEALQELRATFPSKSESWLYRAVYRCLLGVTPIAPGKWLVKGSRKLGDAYPLYTVWLANGKYTCSCYYRAWGKRRKKEICTHIAAVILHRRQKKLVEYL